MNTRKLSRILILGGAAVVVLSVVWFLAAYAEAIEFFGELGGGDMGAEMMACLYSSPAICQGVSALSDAPSYSPVVFWIGLIALLAGVIVRFSLNKPASESGPAGTSSAGSVGAETSILGFIPEQKYVRIVYILILIGAACSLLLPPLAIVGVVGFVLGLLGLFVFRTRLNALDVNHLAALCVVFAAAFVVLFITLGSFLFLLASLAQLALYYIGFNSYRHGRTVGIGTLKDEVRLALKPVTGRLSSRERS
jgi:hypothetical protein